MASDTPPPAIIAGPAAWTGDEMRAEPDKWLVELGQTNISELEAATKQVLAGAKDLTSLTRQDFPLPNFADHLAALSAKLTRGIGFELLRGLPVHSYDRRFVAAMFLGIGAHLGTVRSQNANGHLLGHVRDTGADVTDTDVRVYQTTERQSFHTDSTDAVGLLCLQPAMRGGISLLVSAMTIYNEMRNTRPELAMQLFAPVATDRRGEVPAGEKPYFEIPVLNWHSGFLTALYHRQYIESARRFAHAPPLTQAPSGGAGLF